MQYLGVKSRENSIAPHSDIKYRELHVVKNIEKRTLFDYTTIIEKSNIFLNRK